MTDKAQKIDLFTISREELIEIVSHKSFTKPINYYFMLVLPTVEEKTRGGIILSSDTAESALVGNNIGRVVGIGKTVSGATGAYTECLELEIGDYVIYNPHAGAPLFHSNMFFITIADQGFRARVYDISTHTDGIFKTYSIKGVN